MPVYQHSADRSNGVHLVGVEGVLASRDRVFYYGSHVIHATAMQVFLNYEKVLRSMNDLEEIVVFLNGEFEGCFLCREALGGGSERVLRDGEAGDFAVARANHANRHIGGVEVGVHRSVSRSDRKKR